MNPARARYVGQLAPRHTLSQPSAGSGFTRIPAQHGMGLLLEAGASLTVMDPEGEQVSDAYFVRAAQPEDHFSGGRTTDHSNTPYVGPGSTLFSAAGVPIARITADSVGVHDMSLTPCSQVTFDLLYPELDGAPHRSCWANLVEALGPYGVPASSIGTTLNLFMDVWTDAQGELHIDPPPTLPGDFVTITALDDLIVGLTACSAEKSNNGLCTPIDVRVSR